MNTLKRLTISGALFGLMVVLTPAMLDAQRSGVEAWSQTCGNCHEIQPPNRYNPEQWHKLATHMSIAARLSDAEKDAVLQFLVSGARRIAAADPVGEDSWLVASTETMVPPLGSDAQEDWQANCTACHGANGAGDGPAAMAFDPKPPDMTSAEFQEARTEEALIEAITEGKGGMPAFGSQLTELQIRELVDYIRAMVEDQ